MILKLFKISRQKLKVKSISVSINHNKTPGCHGRVVFCLPRLAEENAWGPAGDMDVFSSAYRPPGWPMVGHGWPTVGQWLANGWSMAGKSFGLSGQWLANGWSMAGVWPMFKGARWHNTGATRKWWHRNGAAVFFVFFVQPRVGRRKRKSKSRGSGPDFQWILYGFLMF